MPRTTIPLLLLALTGCARPLAEGPWTVTLDGAPGNGCDVDETLLGVGVPFAISVAWEGDSLIIGGLGPVTEWDFDGASTFTSAWTEEMEVADPCYLTTDFDLTGTIVTSTAFNVDGSFTQGPLGDCSAAPVQVQECTTGLEYSAVYDGA